MTDASIESMRDTGAEDKVLESAIATEKTKTERKTERKKENGKEKEGAKDRNNAAPPIKILEDIVMKDIGRYSPSEDLSEYEKELEDAAPENPPITKKQATKCQVVLAKAEKPKLQPANHKPTTKAVDKDQYVDMIAEK